MAVNTFRLASSMTALTRSSNRTGSTITLRGMASNSPERIGTVLPGSSVISMRRLSSSALSDKACSNTNRIRMTVLRSCEGGQ